MIRRLLLTAALSAALASKSMAQAAHVQDIGTGSVTGGTTISLNVASSVAVNDMVLMAISTNTNSVVPSVADSRGNTYLLGSPNTTSTGLIATGFSCFVTTALLSGDTITVTFPVAVDGLVTASDFSGLDINIGGLAGDHNSASASFATAPDPGVATGELLYAWVALSGTSSSVTQDPTFASLPAVTANGLTLFPAYKVAPSGGTYTFSGTLGASEQWVAQIENVRLPAPTPTPIPQTAVVTMLETPMQVLLVVALALVAFILLRRHA
jgi:hypothetical protein